MNRAALLLFAFCLWAAEPWQSKPFADWTDKDVQKVLNNSPWSRSVVVPGGPAAGDRSAGRPLQDPTLTPGVSMPSEAPVNTIGGKASPGGGFSAPRNDPGIDLRTIPLTVRWQSALPVKQALARLKYGAEAATSPEAKKFIDDSTVYLIAVAGLPPTLGFSGFNLMKNQIMAETSLSSKGKNLRPSDVILAPPGKVVETFFVFQKTTPFTADDKDVEFSTRLGALDVRCKFRLKDMLYNGALEL